MSGAGRASALVVLGNPEKAWTLGVIGKRTYLVKRGGCVEASEQVALVEDLEIGEDGASLLHDSDLTLHRARADVIVRGHAQPPAGLSQFDARVRAGDLSRVIRVFGPRRVERGPGGDLRFTPPGPLERVPLDWSMAFGGFDRASLQKHGDPYQPVAELRGSYDPRFGIHAYPRNPLGKGYLIEASGEGLASCELPQIEDPDHLLRPETIAVGSPSRWPQGPPVAALGWLNYNFFPRSAQAGLIPTEYDEPAFPPGAFFEVMRGEVKEETVAPSTPLVRRLDARVGQGSAIGMRATTLEPGDEVELLNLHPGEPRWGFRLPKKGPRMAARLPDEKPASLRPRIRTLIIEPDLDRVIIVWVGELPLAHPVGPGKKAKIEHAVLWDR